MQSIKGDLQPRGLVSSSVSGIGNFGHTWQTKSVSGAVIDA